MPAKPPPRTRTPARSLDWATAATEERRQRDAVVKLVFVEQRQRWRQERAASAAWSPRIEIVSRTRKA
jgi:hypothetical protein